jgi:hypothetical protein
MLRLRLEVRGHQYNGEIGTQLLDRVGEGDAVHATRHPHITKDQVERVPRRDERQGFRGVDGFEHHISRVTKRFGRGEPYEHVVLRKKDYGDMAVPWPGKHIATRHSNVTSNANLQRIFEKQRRDN